MKLIIIFFIATLVSCASAPKKKIDQSVPPAPENIGQCLGICEEVTDCDGKEFKLITKEACSNAGGLFRVTD